MIVGTHHTTICIGTVSNLDPERLKAQPGIDFYFASGADVTEAIDLALLDHLHCQRTIVFVGGEQAECEARAYGVKWIEDTPAVNEALLRFWRNSVPELDCP
jgi:hypothetical protein